MITKREGYAYVEIDRTGLYPNTRLMTPEKTPDERVDRLSKFVEPFDGKLVHITVEAVSPEEEKRLREKEATI